MTAKLTTTKGNYRAMKVQIAAKYSGVKLTENIVDKVDKFGKLESDSNTFTNAATSAFHLANTQLRGGECKGAQAKVGEYTFTSEHDIFDIVMAWVLPATGLSTHESLVECAKVKLLKIMGDLNKQLALQTFLVGERITLADISVATALLPAYQYVLVPDVKKDFVNLNRWFDTVVNQKEFIDVAGKIEYCNSVKRLSAADAKKGDSSKKGQSAKKDDSAKKAEPAKKAQPAETEAPAQQLDDNGLLIIKEKDPFAKYPKGTFDFDDFKRFYSNNDCDKSIPYFWEKLDTANYSLWYCEYKYPEDLTQVFMSCNLISGMMQRLDKMRKNSFGSMLLFGEDNKSTISGVWVWKGQDLAFELSPDWQIDYNSYQWTKLDPADAKTKTLVQEYFSWEGSFDGKKFNQGKIFK